MKVLDVAEAVKTILDQVEPIQTSHKIYIDASLNRVVASNIVSEVELPSFTRSAMDGFALVGKHTTYKLVDDEAQLEDGRCIRVNTGFPIPEKAYAVAEVEKVSVDGDRVTLKDSIEEKRNFTFKGSELKKDTTLLERGSIIGPKELSLLAYAGVFSFDVYRKPLVGIITTGDEVVFPSCHKNGNTVYNSNYFITKELCEKWLSDTVYFGHIPDDPYLFESRMSEALNRCDLVVTTGGVSKGTMDYTKKVLNKLGAKFLFEKTTIKPGKPATFAVYENKYIMALPGWPAALYTTAYIYLKPALLKLADASSFENRFLIGVLDEDMHSRKGKDYFNRVLVDYRNGEYHLRSSGVQTTDNFHSLARASGLVWLDKTKGDVPKGSRHPFILIE